MATEPCGRQVVTAGSVASQTLSSLWQSSLDIDEGGPAWEWGGRGGGKCLMGGDGRHTRHY